MTDEHELGIPANAGGRPLRGFLPGIRPETVMDGAAATAGAGDGGAGGGESAAAGGEAVQGGEAASTEGAAAAAQPLPQLDFSDPRVVEAVGELAGSIVEERFGQLEQLLAQTLGGEGAGEGGGAAVEPGALNPWDENFAGNLDARFQALEQRIGGMLDQLAAPLQERHMAEQVAAGNENLKDMLADDVARNGDFPRAVDPATGQPAAASQAESLVIPLARFIFPDIAARYGQTARAAEFAVSRAAGIVRSIVAEAQAAATNAQTNRLEGLAVARGELAAGGEAAVQGVGEIKAKTIEEGLSAVTARHATLLRGGS